MLAFKEIKAAVTRIGKKYKIDNAYLFGSYAKGNADESSDVDIIISRGGIDTLTKLGSFAAELEDELGKPVDVLLDDGIKPRFFELIKNDRIALYGI